MRGCLKDVSSHLRGCKFLDPENEVDLILSRVDDFANRPTHRSNLDQISVESW